MISIGQEIIDFEIIGVKPKFNNHEENGKSALIIGCGKCINAHENILRENKISKLYIQTVARIASIVNSIANVIRVLN